jgi:hypothetical protein
VLSLGWFEACGYDVEALWRFWALGFDDRHGGMGEPTMSYGRQKMDNDAQGVFMDPFLLTLWNNKLLV